MTGPHRPPFPVGWFAVAAADEVPEGALVPLAAFGQDLAVGRTPAGGALVAHATCPHLGADLAVGGRIDDDGVTCPLHEWCFSHSGACTSAGDGPVPEAIELRVWPTGVSDGTVWAFHGRSGEEPAGPPPRSGGRATTWPAWSACWPASWPIRARPTGAWGTMEPGWSTGRTGSGRPARARWFSPVAAAST